MSENINVKQANAFTSAFKGTLGKGCGCVAMIVIVFVFIGILSDSGSNKTTTSTDTQTSGNSTDKPKTQEPSVPAEYKSALAQATSYADTMHMSKRGVYDQLVSEYGGQFSAEASQYAIDNVKADWNANALLKAKSYQDTMHLSPNAIRDQLTSEYGEKFTQGEADYAIKHLND